MQKSTKKNVSLKKRESIIASALSAFLELGYSGTTIDEIVKRAGGSKASIYKHFKDKEDLFATVVDELVRHRLMNELNPDDPPEKALLEYAESRLKIVFTKKHIALRRLVIGEGARLPSIARTYYEHGPALSIKQLEKYLKIENSRGSLKVADPHSAATMFTGMLMHYMYLRTLFSISVTPSSKQLKEHARKVVDTFLAAHHV
jgi:TetR/AcrR family transcriptional regulator, mexJK operon transcriptional repressor